MNAKQEIQALVQSYLASVYEGDVTSLAKIFDVDAQVYGEVDGKFYHKTIADYLRGVAERKSPKDNGEPFLMKLLTIDVCGNIASVKLHSPMFGFNYQLYFSLVLHDGKWRIVNKTFTNLAV